MKIEHGYFDDENHTVKFTIEVDQDALLEALATLAVQAAEQQRKRRDFVAATTIDQLRGGA